MTYTVSDENGIILPGATVTAKGINTALTTNVNGKFSIEVPASLKSLATTFIGMQQEIVSVLIISCL